MLILADHMHTNCVLWSELGPQISDQHPEILRCIDVGVLQCMKLPVHMHPFWRVLVAYSPT